uniref:Uncharacterized protein n=1 Tax=Ditylenchus dipsaci TaxID=166011 RepID=A0A915ERH8_9BILA
MTLPSGISLTPIPNSSPNFYSSLECCQYPPLLLSSHQGYAFLVPGDIWSGGAVLNAHNHRLYAFDYISDLIPQFSEEGS